MKTLWKKGIYFLLTLAFVIMAFGIGTVPVQAAAKYKKSDTKTYTIKVYNEYKIPIKMKEKGKIKVTVQLQGKPKNIEIPFGIKDKNNMFMTTKGPSKELGSGGKWLSKKISFSVEAPKGNASYLYMYISGENESTEKSAKLKITVSSSKEIVSVGKLKKI